MELQSKSRTGGEILIISRGGEVENNKACEPLTGSVGWFTRKSGT